MEKQFEHLSAFFQVRLLLLTPQFLADMDFMETIWCWRLETIAGDIT